MAAGALAGILIKLAVAVLQYYQGRADYRDKVLLEVRNAGLQAALEAERYKADARLHPGSQRFGVRGKPKSIPPKDAGPHD